jgi:hypothetical protein
LSGEDEARPDDSGRTGTDSRSAGRPSSDGDRTGTEDS